MVVMGMYLFKSAPRKVMAKKLLAKVCNFRDRKQFFGQNIFCLHFVTNASLQFGISVKVQLFI
jgi:hypothetical protein